MYLRFCPLFTHEEKNGMKMKAIGRVFVSASLIDAVGCMVAFAAGTGIA